MHLVRRPACAGKLPETVAEARVQREHDALGAVATDPGGDRFGIANGHAADNDAFHASVEQAAHAVFIANAAARLHPEATTGGNAGDGGKVLELAGTRTIQVDDVQPRCALVRIAGGKRLRLEGEGSLLRVVALEEADHLAFAQVDSGDG